MKRGTKTLIMLWMGMRSHDPRHEKWFVKRYKVDFWQMLEIKAEAERLRCLK